MVTLNKPAAGNTDWYQAVTDNWTAIEGAVNQAICEGRLTLSSGNPGYNPQAKTPSSTSTGSDTVDFATAHGWTTGTMVTPSATGGGLTNGTTYYINAVDSDTVSFHTTLANAESGASKVDLTASITAAIQPFGVSRTTVYFTPYKGDRIGVYNGTTWNIYTLTEKSLSISALTASTNYDIFIYDNAGTLTLESLAWADNTTRATALTTQDGIKVKSGATTRRYLGTIRITATTGQCEDSDTKRFVSNYYNRMLKRLFSCPAYNNNNAGTTYTTTSTTWTPANGGTGSKLEFIAAEVEAVRISLSYMLGSAAVLEYRTGVGIDSTTSATFFVNEAANAQINAGNCYSFTPAEGYHHLNLLINVNGGTGTWGADSVRMGGTFDMFGTFICAEVMA